jgi:hypothetical protein
LRVGERRRNYLSITWTTPLATRTLGVTTFAELTKTVPFSTVMVTFPPPTVFNVVFVSRGLYPTVPVTIWYTRMLANSAVLKLPRDDPTAWNAALLGAKTVTSWRPSTMLA